MYISGIDLYFHVVMLWNLTTQSVHVHGVYKAISVSEYMVFNNDSAKYDCYRDVAVDSLGKYSTKAHYDGLVC